MKRSKTLVLGIICGAICVACSLAYTHQVRSEAESERSEALERYGGEQLEVCVAKRDIAPGETIDDASIETRMWLADLLPDEAIRATDDAVGKSVSSSIVAGEVITQRRLGNVGDELDVPEGLTAVSVPAKDVQAVGGAVAPGSKIDVYATGGTSTEVIAQSVLVLATSAADAQSDTSVTWITVAVEPEMVQEMVVAAQKTELYFTLPGTDSKEPPDDSDTSDGNDKQPQTSKKDNSKKAEDTSSSSKKGDAT